MKQDARQQRARGPISQISSDGMTVLPPDFRGLHRELLHHHGYRSGGARRLPAAQLTADWLRANGAFRPVLVPAAPSGAAAVGLRLPPPGAFTPEKLAARLGPGTEVATLDTQSQGDGPRWTLHQWSLYWDARRALGKDAGAGGTPRSLAPAPADPNCGGAAGAHAAHAPPFSSTLPAVAEDEADSAAVTQRRPTDDASAAPLPLKGIKPDARRRLLEVPALPLLGGALEAEVGQPAAVAGVDLRAAWPADAPNLPAPSLYLTMAAEGAFADFALAPGGASLWLHLVSGAKTLALIPPTPRNLATYAAWASGPRQAAVFLAAHCEGVVKVDVGPGDTLFVPAGWAYASATTVPAVGVGGSFLRGDCVAVQLEVWRIEERLGARPCDRCPMFKMLHWYLAAQLAARLQALAELSDAELAQRVAQALEAEAAAPPAADEEDKGRAAAAEVHGNSGSVLATSRRQAGGSTRKRRRADEEEGEEVTTRPRQAMMQQTAAQPRPQQRSQQPQAQQRAHQRPQPLGQAARPVARPPGAVVPQQGTPRMVGRTPGKSRLGGGPAGGGAARLPSRLHPTQQRFDVGSGGGGRRGDGGGRQRECSPDSFIDGGDELSDLEEDNEERDWDPSRRRRGGGGESDDDALSDDELLEDELLLKEELQRGGWAGEDDDEEGRPRTRRRAAELGAPSPAAAGARARRGWAEEEQEEKAGRKSTRFRGNLPPRLAAMLHDEEADEDEGAEEQAQPWPPRATPAAAATASPGRPLKLKVKLPAGVGAPGAGSEPPVAGSPAPPRVVLRLRPPPQPRPAAAAEAHGLEEGGDEVIPQVDGAADYDPLQAMYAELYRQAEEGEGEEEEEAPAGDPYLQWQLAGTGAAPAPATDQQPPPPQAADAAWQQPAPTSAGAAEHAAPQEQAPAPTAAVEHAAPPQPARTPAGCDGVAAAVAGSGVPADTPAQAAELPPASPPLQAPAEPRPDAASLPAAPSSSQLARQQVPAQPLSDEEAQGVAALVAALRRWLKAPSALNDVPLAIQHPKARPNLAPLRCGSPASPRKPMCCRRHLLAGPSLCLPCAAQELMVRLEVCMRALGLPLKPPPPVNLSAVSADELLEGAGGGGALGGDTGPEGEQGGDFAPREEGGAGDPVVVEESSGPKHRPAHRLPAVAAGGGGRGAAAALPTRGAARRGGSKKLGVKDRLRKKLGL
eukprot:scaffold21.g2115.t1